MPEGPSIVILKEEAARFAGKKVQEAGGNAKIDIDRINGKTVRRFVTWGKQFLICFDDFYLRVHLLLFGSYRINETREMKPRLMLKFSNGQLNFYSCSVRMLEGTPDDVYDWEADTMSDRWNAAKAFRAVAAKPKRCVSDVLLDQDIFAGSGNIVKNEVLFRLRIHPESIVGAMTQKMQKALVKDVRDYCFLFYEWKKQYVLRKHWLIYRKSVCPNCGGKVTLKPTGLGLRRSFFCTDCQVLYTKIPAAKK
jgi:endonuclease VIII